MRVRVGFEGWGRVTVFSGLWVKGEGYGRG